MYIKKKLFILLISLSCSILAFTVKAQDSTKVKQPNEVISLTKVKLSLLALDLEREQKIAPTTTIYAGVGVATVLVQLIEYHSFTDVRSGADYNISPNFYVGLRKYYNFERRIKKGRKTINNSANYFGLEVTAMGPVLITDDYTTNWAVVFTPQYGFQRNIGKRFNFELSTGPTLQTDFKESAFGASLKIGFSFLL